MNYRSIFAFLIVQILPGIISAQVRPIVEFQDGAKAKHFYQVILKVNVKWLDAEKLATLQAHVDEGTILTGYLATISSWEEQQFLIREFGGDARLWIGGRKLKTGPNKEWEWRWVTGPEGLEVDGQGKLFWQWGAAEPGRVFNNAFQDWILPDNVGFTGEPDDDRGHEEFLIWNFHSDNRGKDVPGVHGRLGLWNDYPNEGKRDGRPMGYIVEFGM